MDLCPSQLKGPTVSTPTPAALPEGSKVKVSVVKGLRVGKNYMIKEGVTYIGRQGPEELGPRLIATVWDSRDAMATAVGESFDQPIFLPKYLDETTDRVLEVKAFVPIRAMTPSAIPAFALRRRAAFP